jgi:hypothetical protein
MKTHAHEQVHWQAPRPSVGTTDGLQAGAVVLGTANAIAVEAILVNGIVNTQEVQTFYSSAPHRSRWVGHGISGATLGLISSALLEKRGASPQRRHSL